MDDIADLLALQSGVISRRQVEARGETVPDIARRLRRREWVRLLPGVYVDHTGRPSWLQRAWAGVLYYWPAAVADESALHLAGASRQAEQVVIAVGRSRNVRERDGFRLRWVADLEAVSLFSTSPPRMRVEDAALRVASSAPRELDAVQVLAGVVQQRLSTAPRMDAALTRHPRLPSRRWLAEVLADVAAGTHSVLEREYLARVERAHGLPGASRQLRSVGQAVRYADAAYPDYDLELELDGRFVHDTATQRRRDLDRDLDVAASGRTTLRIGWGQVFGGACRTAARLVVILRRRGWTGAPVVCGPGCPVGDLPSL